MRNRGDFLLSVLALVAALALALSVHRGLPPGDGVSAATPQASNSRTQPGSSDADLRAVAEQAFATISAARQEAGLPALTWDESLFPNCYDTARYMADNHVFGHDLPGQPHVRLCTLFSEDCVYCGENLSLQPTLKAMAETTFRNSPPHWQLVIDPRLTRAAVAVAEVQEYVNFVPTSSSGHETELLQFGEQPHYILVYHACMEAPQALRSLRLLASW